MSICHELVSCHKLTRAVYHIHEKSIDSTGNCSTAGGHLDPYGNGGTGCNTSDKASCEVGDLSGKNGKMEGITFTAK